MRSNISQLVVQVVNPWYLTILQFLFIYNIVMKFQVRYWFYCEKYESLCGTKLGILTRKSRETYYRDGTNGKNLLFG